MLRTAEFVPYVVFIEAPDFETLRAMNRAALESGVSTKQLTVRGSEMQREGSDGCLGWEGAGQRRREEGGIKEGERCPPKVLVREDLRFLLYRCEQGSKVPTFSQSQGHS